MNHSIINEIARKIEAIKTEIAVFLVLNIKQETEAEEDYIGDSITSEYFSLQEAQDIIDGFTKLEIYTHVYKSEKEFIKALSSGQINKLPHKHKIVYSSTGTGTVRSKSALIPSICSLYQLSYCSNDIYTAALLENKVHVLNLLKQANFHLPEYWVYNSKLGWEGNNEPRSGIKLIAKPAYECASIGISDASVSFMNDEYVKHIRKLSIDYKQPIIVEEFISGYEIEIPVFDLAEPFCSMAVGIKEGEKEEMGESFLTYDKVEVDNYEFYNFDKFNPTTAEKLKAIAISSFKVLGLTGLVRVDFRLSTDGRPYIMDYNNSPHITPNHSCAFSIMENGYAFEDVLRLLLWRGLDSVNWSSISEDL